MFKFFVMFFVAAGLFGASAAEAKSSCTTVKVVQVLDFGASGMDALMAELRDANPGARIETGRCAGALSLHPDTFCVRIEAACQPVAAAAKK